MGKKYSILIVEDDKTILRNLVSCVEKTGMFKHIITATEGDIASSKIQNQKFDLIVLDYNLPKKSASRIIDTIGKEKFNPDSILICSGELDKVKMRTLMQKGIRNFIMKPFTGKAFLEKVIELTKK